MITGKCKVLVIAAIDGSALKNPLDQAKKKGIKVIAYDRLIMNTDAVSYYATFDNYKVGSIQGEYLVDKLGLKADKFDLHCHTPASDGAKELIDLLIDAEKEKLDIISFTDHDTLDIYEYLDDIDYTKWFSGKIIYGVEIF